MAIPDHSEVSKTLSIFSLRKCLPREDAAKGRSRFISYLELLLADQRGGGVAQVCLLKECMHDLPLVNPEGVQKAIEETPQQG